MREQNRDSGLPNKPPEFNRLLDAALAKYSAVEPRAGLEERILTKLRVAQSTATNRTWWRWEFVAAALAVIVVMVVLAWRSGHPAPQVIVNHIPGAAIQQPSKQGRTDPVKGDHPLRQKISPRKTIGYPVQPATTAAINPKLDQFPSAQPMSQEEKSLAAYVRDYHEEAVLIARAREEQLRRDRAQDLSDQAYDDFNEQHTTKSR